MPDLPQIFQGGLTHPEKLINVIYSNNRIEQGKNT